MPKAARPILFALIVVASLASCSKPGSSHASAGSGTLAVELTDAPFLVHEVRNADVFVVRVDARLARTDAASADRGSSDDSASSDGWITIASPNVLVNLLDYQYHVSLPLGNAKIPAGIYQGFRLVIDPSRSSLTLMNGMVLTSTSVPNVDFPAVARIGIPVYMQYPAAINRGEKTTLSVDFAVDESFELRGKTIAEKGLVFHPVLRGTVHQR